MSLALDGIRKTFDSGFRLSIDLEAGNGITVLFGRSGCGKTSMLRLIAGLIEPDAGRIALNGATFFDASQRMSLPVFKRRIGYIFQQSTLFPHLTVEENIRYGACAPDDIGDLLDRFHIAPLRNRYPRDISGGEQQRVALARSLASQPRLLLMDEPFSALDERARMGFQEDLLRLKDRTAIPIILVTHSLNEAFALADRLVLLENGQVAESYDAVHLFSRPMKRVTAELLGVQNLIPCEIREIYGDRITVHTGAFDAVVDPDERFRTGDRAYLGIRAVDVRLVVRDEPRENSVTATIQRIIPSVVSNHILLKIESSSNEYDLIMDLDEHHCIQHMIRQGKTIRVELRRSKLFLCE